MGSGAWSRKIDTIWLFFFFYAKFNGAKYGHSFFYISFLLLSYYNTCVCCGNFERCDLNQLTWVIKIYHPPYFSQIFILKELPPFLSNFLTFIQSLLGWDGSNWCLGQDNLRCLFPFQVSFEFSCPRLFCLYQGIMT